MNILNSEKPETLARVHTHSAPVRRLIYNRWESYLVKSNQQPVPSLGAEMVTLGLSVDKGVCEPKRENVKRLSFVM